MPYTDGVLHDDRSPKNRQPACRHSNDAEKIAKHLLETDQANVWHPYASAKLGFAPYLVTDASGATLTLTDGAQNYTVVDGMSSWWCKIHGYRNPVMDNALKEQIARYSHVMFGGLTHEFGIKLCQKLTQLTGYDRAFLADSGSVAMEVALKLARQVQIARHDLNPTAESTSQRTRFAALRGGYHGDTWGVMSVCDPDLGMHTMYSDSLQQQIFLPRPPAFNADEEAVANWCSEAEKLIESCHLQLAGIVYEPILQGAGGMWMWHPQCLSFIRTLCDKYQLLMIADEIATGFGRTGKMFAYEWVDVKPDIMAVGKALTGGYLTQAAVLTTQELTDQLELGQAKVLMHGPTFMANPLACAASLASISILETGQWPSQVELINRVFTAQLSELKSHPLVADVRFLGAAAAVELTQPVDMRIATTTAIKTGVWLRPFGKVIYSLPPYICSEEELKTVASAICSAVHAQGKTIG